jgi:hypothetical protein
MISLKTFKSSIVRPAWDFPSISSILFIIDLQPSLLLCHALMGLRESLKTANGAVSQAASKDIIKSSR